MSNEIIAWLTIRAIARTLIILSLFVEIVSFIFGDSNIMILSLFTYVYFVNVEKDSLIHLRELKK